MLSAEVKFEFQHSLQPSAFSIQNCMLRIIAGSLRGRRLDVPDWAGLRPTSDKLRETLFNVLGPRIVGARVLDGYAGTGAVGIEALSRGAAHVTFVDSDRRAIRLIESNLERCGLNERYAIIRVDFARTPPLFTADPFDIVFLDPPYGKNEMTAALASAAALAVPGMLFVVEHAKRDAPPPQEGRLALTRDLASGDSGLAFYSVA
jgi:16S rRNA (guanine(966)-N(2))-methyltransferase RsmD